MFTERPADRDRLHIVTAWTQINPGEIARKTNTDTFDYVKGKGTALEGTFECTGGTGRFEGFKGTGADYYFDFTMNCKKP